MWKAIIVSALLLVVIVMLSVMQGGKAGLDPRDQLMFERQRAERRQALVQSGAVSPGLLSCAASRASEATVQTVYLVWINHRRDLVTGQQQDDARSDLERSIKTCGGDVDGEEDAAHKRGIDLGEAAALAMLQAGR